MNQYDQYLESNVMTASPIELVRMLYRFVIEQLQDASRCHRAGDIQGRGNATTKATDGIVELLNSLNHDQGAGVSGPLTDLYSYMAARVLQGHIDQDCAPFEEVEKLMTTLLDGWTEIQEERPASSAAYGVVPAEYTPLSASF